MAIIAGTGAVGQNTGYYAFLPNVAGDIDRDGFDIGYHAVYTQWDLNGDGSISESEFYTVIFQRLDSNRNGSLTLNEWAPGQQYLFGKFIKSNKRARDSSDIPSNKISQSLEDSGFESFDSNKDKKITPGEFDKGIRNTGFFRSYDSNQNGSLDREELNKGVYKNMDLDGNGLIDRKEFDTVSKLFID